MSPLLYDCCTHSLYSVKFTICSLIYKCPPPFGIYRILASLRVEIPSSFPQSKTSCPQRHVTGPASCCTPFDLHERIKEHRSLTFILSYQMRTIPFLSCLSN